MRKLFFIIGIVTFMFSENIYANSKLDACVNALDTSFRKHYSLLAVNMIDNGGEPPQLEEEKVLIHSLHDIKIGCNETIYRLSVQSFYKTVFGTELEDNLQQRCIFEIYGVYGIVFMDEVKKLVPDLLNDEDVMRISDSAIKMIQETQNCSPELKNKILEKLNSAQSDQESDQDTH